MSPTTWPRSHKLFPVPLQGQTSWAALPGKPWARGAVMVHQLSNSWQPNSIAAINLQGNIQFRKQRFWQRQNWGFEGWGSRAPVSSRYPSLVSTMTRTWRDELQVCWSNCWHYVGIKFWVCICMHSVPQMEMKYAGELAAELRRVQGLQALRVRKIFIKSSLQNRSIDRQVFWYAAFESNCCSWVVWANVTRHRVHRDAWRWRDGFNFRCILVQR